MLESCFCGRSGGLEGREPVFATRVDGRCDVPIAVIWTI